jgi:hypothetical protein
MDALQGIERFAVAQKITLMVNRYEIRAVDGNGQPAGLLAVAQQKRAAFKEQVTFYADESRKTPDLLLQGKAALRPRRHLRRPRRRRHPYRQLPEGLRQVAAALHLAPRRSGVCRPWEANAAPGSPSRAASGSWCHSPSRCPRRLCSTSTSSMPQVSS